MFAVLAGLTAAATRLRCAHAGSSAAARCLVRAATAAAVHGACALLGGAILRLLSGCGTGLGGLATIASACIAAVATVAAAVHVLIGGCWTR